MKTIFDSDKQLGSRQPTFGFKAPNQLENLDTKFLTVPEKGPLKVLSVTLAEMEFLVDERQLQEVAIAKACQLQRYPNVGSERLYLSQLRGRPMLVLSPGPDPDSDISPEDVVLVWSLPGILLGLLVNSVGPSQEIESKDYRDKSRDKNLEFRQGKTGQKLLVLSSVFRLAFQRAQ